MQPKPIKFAPSIVSISLISGLATYFYLTVNRVPLTWVDHTKGMLVAELFFSLLMPLIINLASFSLLYYLLSRRKLGTLQWKRVFRAFLLTALALQVLPLAAGLIFYWGDIPGSVELFNYAEITAQLILVSSIVSVTVGLVVAKIPSEPSRKSSHT